MSMHAFSHIHHPATALTTLQSLQHLKLTGHSSLPSVSLVNLSALTRLTNLMLTAINGSSELARTMTSLQSLYLAERTRVTSPLMQLQSLQGLTRLRSLSCIRKQLVGDLSILQHLSNLQEVHIEWPEESCVNVAAVHEGPDSLDDFGQSLLGLAMLTSLKLTGYR